MMMMMMMIKAGKQDVVLNLSVQPGDDYTFAQQNGKPKEYFGCSTQLPICVLDV
jgi:hypothetical protein